MFSIVIVSMDQVRFTIIPQLIIKTDPLVRPNKLGLRKILDTAAFINLVISLCLVYNCSGLSKNPSIFCGILCFVPCAFSKKIENFALVNIRYRGPAKDTKNQGIFRNFLKENYSI
jgi:hypothetical protein